MTNRVLTTLAIRFAALLLFMKLFEQFNSYFISIYYTVIIPFYEKALNTSLENLAYSGTSLLLINLVVSSFLFFKAEWVASKLIKQDSDIHIELTPHKLIRVILLTTGTIWLATSVYLLPDLYDFILKMIALANDEKLDDKVEFSPIYYVLKTSIALLFVFRVDKISSYLEKRLEPKEVKQQEVHNNEPI